VLFFSRFVFNKGIDVLLDAIALLNAEGKGHLFRFTLAGKGPLFDEYSQSRNYSNVIFPGFVADEELAALYQAQDLFILPTLYEGMPTVVLEAMAQGLPVLVTDVGATRELVDESNGRIIPIKDPRATADALLGMAALPAAQRLAMGRASYERVLSRFTWEAVAAQHEALFRQISATLSAHAP
jgi:glycosyltransferase involved in cell wall biosynthesis